MELEGPESSAGQASGARGLLLGFQVLFNIFKFFSQVWHVIVLSQIHSNHVAQSKSELKQQNRRVILQTKFIMSLHKPNTCATSSQDAWQVTAQVLGVRLHAT